MAILVKFNNLTLKVKVIYEGQCKTWRNFILVFVITVVLSNIVNCVKYLTHLVNFHFKLRTWDGICICTKFPANPLNSLYRNNTVDQIVWTNFLHVLLINRLILFVFLSSNSLLCCTKMYLYHLIRDYSDYYNVQYTCIYV